MNIKSIVLIISIFLALLFNGCAVAQPKVINTKDFSFKDKLVFNTSLENVVNATKEVFKEKEWEVFYSGKNQPTKSYSYFSNTGILFDTTDYDKLAWNKNLSKDIKPSHYLTGKTPTNLVSFGAEFFIVLYIIDENTTVLQASIASSQIAEKDKLEFYLKELTQLLNEKLN